MVKTRRWFRKKRKIVKGGRIRLSADRVENLKKTKKMKCNPAMDKMQTVTDHSCLSFYQECFKMRCCIIPFLGSVGC